MMGKTLPFGFDSTIGYVNQRDCRVHYFKLFNIL